MCLVAYLGRGDQLFNLVIDIGEVGEASPGVCFNMDGKERLTVGVYQVLLNEGFLYSLMIFLPLHLHQGRPSSAYQSSALHF